MHTELIWGSLFFKDKKFTIFKFILQFKQTATFNFFNWPLVFFLGLLSSVGEVLLLIPYIEGKKKVNTIQSSLTSIILLIAYKLMSKLQNKNYIKNYNKSETFESEIKKTDNIRNGEVPENKGICSSKSQYKWFCYFYAFKSHQRH